MNRIKVYNADGKFVDAFNKPKSKNPRDNHNMKIVWLNKHGFYIRNQTTNKGVKIHSQYRVTAPQIIH